MHLTCLLALCCVAFLCRIQAILAESTSQISFPLLSYFSQTADNVLVSPLSISTCFSLVLPGARGNTKTQIVTALSYPDSESDATYNTFNSKRVSYNAKYPAGVASTSGVGSPPPVLQIANSVWVHQGLPLESAYQQLIQDMLIVVDFTDSSSSTALNSWVANHTHNKIKSVVTSPGGLPGKMIAVNAVYFKATWSKQFVGSMTGLGTFYSSQDRQTVVKDDSHFMHQVDYFKYTSTSSHQVIALPYSGTSMEMVVALPMKTGSEFSVADLANAFIGMENQRIALSLPKFEFTAEYLLNDALKSMGMLDPFSENDADFSGLSSSVDLFISKVIHKTFIAVDEFGTEAAAVTAIVMSPTSHVKTHPTPILFKADHPFVFFLRDRADGTVLFAGRVGMPLVPEGSVVPAMQADADKSIWQEKFGTSVILPSTEGAISNVSSSNAVPWNRAGPWPLLLLLFCRLK